MAVAAMSVNDLGSGAWRVGSVAARDIRIDLFWLLGLGLLLIATGIGLRDPWPPDEPRFALIARDMVASGEWLVPRVGGDVYADKPPLYFWLIALSLDATGSLRIAFLLPSLLSGLGCLVLVYDLARRVWNRETGFAAGLLLLFTVQFMWQARQAQIDATLSLWTTLSLYGLLRHVLLGPQWGWYAIGWAAAGLGVITKGVGFLPLLVLLPFVWLRARGWSTPRFESRANWWLGPAAFMAAVGIWLLPMLWAAHGDPAIAAYRDEILFRQTIERYANAWHHRQPFWYFIAEVIPGLWLPLIALVPWLVPRWRDALRRRELPIALLLSWVGLVVLFFSCSAGKRGVYVLPAVPAFALACAPYLIELTRRRGVQRLAFVLSALLVFIMAAGCVYGLIQPERRAELLDAYGLDVLPPLAVLAAVGLLLCALLRPRRGVMLFCSLVATVLLVVSFWINPAMNEARSGVVFARLLEQQAAHASELGIVAFKEQYLLQIQRPIVHFGHARWREADDEAADAAVWLQQRPGRVLVVNHYIRSLCFNAAAAEPLAVANRMQWFLVRGQGDARCLARGDLTAARPYVPKLLD
jgi:4-amino-4-deoxy-L-arabinose transferase-like glycosyltransferase